MKTPLAFPVFVCLACLLTPGAALAQNESRWGVAFGFVPEWESHDVVKILFEDAERLELKGDELRIGVARGRPYGGDWSLSYTRKRIDRGSRVVTQDPVLENFGTGQTFLFAGDFVTEDVQFDGLEFQKFVPFATIKRRAQIGLNWGVGVAKIKGTVIRRDDFADFNQTTFSVFQAHTETQEPANALLIAESEWLPLGRLELAVGAIIVPGLKVRVSGGFNMPGVPAIGGSVVYLFGAD